MSTATVVLGRRGVARLSTGHPWLFADHVESTGDAADGSLVRLEGPAGRPRGFAVFNAGSRIVLRVVSRDPEQVLEGEDWWRERLDRAIAARAARLAPGESACRWVHAEADGLPGLVVDRYGDVAVVQAGCRWADVRARPLAAHLLERHGVRGVLARHDGAFRRHEQLREETVVLAGEVPASVRWTRGGIVRDVDPWHGQKTGTYLDQRENQPWAAGVLVGGPAGDGAAAPDVRCLDVFAGEGGFALHVAAAGAHVTTIDSSTGAAERTASNAAASGVAERVEIVQANAFEQLRVYVAQGRRFDAVVLDPPALAKGRGVLAAARRGYKELNLRALRLLRPGGRLVTCSCSFHLSRDAFRAVIAEAAADARREVFALAERGAASCHPHLVTFPESDYLKVVLLEAW